MFDLHLLINKRGPLAKIWLAAHWEKKLTKTHVFECNLEMTVEKIISPKFTLALRTSGHLLLGVVRIYHRKAKYLLADCSEALTKMKTAFRPGLVDLPKENFEAAYQSITLPEEFHDFETPLPDLNAIDVVEHFALNQSRAEDITLTEDYESNILLCDRHFGESNEEPDAGRKQSFDSSVLTSSNCLVAEHNSASVPGDRSARREDTCCFEDDCFGDEEDAADMIEILLRDEQSGLDKGILDMEEERPLSRDLPENSTASESAASAPLTRTNPLCADPTVQKASHPVNETILLLKEEEFVLEPIDDTAITPRKKNKRKRKLLVDVNKELSCNTIYNQLNDYTDTLAPLDLAPPTKKTMMWKKSGGADKLLSQAALPVVHADLRMLFEKCFKSDRFKMRRSGTQRESETEETRKGQDTTEEPSYLQESARSETERKISNGSFMLASQNNRNETDENCGRTIVSSFLQILLESQWRRTGSCGVAPTLSVHTECGSRSFLCFAKPSATAEVPDSPSSRLHQCGCPGKILFQGVQAENTPSEQRCSGGPGFAGSEAALPDRLVSLLQHLQRSGARSFSFRELCRKNNRKEAAAKFYIFLVLKKQSVIELSQSAPFADVTATLGPTFSAH
ncbi:RD21L protein, partial [Lophotis ruficrista]|nr:RD21L protein [Lophotis ruficrista]